jgi:secreted trypsin-like serine protease
VWRAPRSGVFCGGGGGWWEKECASTKHPDVYTDVAYYQKCIERHLIMSKGEI